jgi:hypothetical protein
MRSQFFKVYLECKGIRADTVVCVLTYEYYCTDTISEVLFYGYREW